LWSMKELVTKMSIDCDLDLFPAVKHTDSFGSLILIGDHLWLARNPTFEWCHTSISDAYKELGNS
jgi:hypothetical protein